MRGSSWVAVVAVLWLVVTPALLRCLAACRAYPPPAPIVVGVDPNTAPWWELSALPGIGEGVAREIVRYRLSAREASAAGDTGPVFRCPADLDRIKGIGPVTILRIAPHLRFDGGDQPTATTESSGPG